MLHINRNYFFLAAAILPLALGACAVEPTTQSADVPVTVYHESTAVVAPATTYYDADSKTTVHVSPTTVTTSEVGPAYVTYQDGEGNWHTTYDVEQ